jgi:hypothetical protein
MQPEVYEALVGMFSVALDEGDQESQQRVLTLLLAYEGDVICPPLVEEPQSLPTSNQASD